MEGVKTKEESIKKDEGGVIVKSNGGERPEDKENGQNVAVERYPAARPVRGVQMKPAELINAYLGTGGNMCEPVCVLVTQTHT